MDKESIIKTDENTKFSHSIFDSEDSTERNNEDNKACLTGIKGTQFRVIKELGVGVCCRVFKITELATMEEYAMKMIPYESEEDKRAKERMLELFKNERSFLKYLGDIPGVIRLAGAYVDSETAYIVTELGKEDLFNWGARSHKNREIRVRHKIKALLEIVSKMHKRNVVHRDIKPENVVLVRSKHDNCSSVRLIDFGEAALVDDNAIFDTIVGTWPYLAPERFHYHKGWELKASDMWAIGVITFELLTRKKCFACDGSEEKIKRQILRNAWSFPVTDDYNNKCVAEECKVSFLAKNFIQSLLLKDPASRLSAKKALAHPWFTHPITSTERIE